MKYEDIQKDFDEYWNNDCTKQEQDFSESVGFKNGATAFLAGYIAAMKAVKAEIKQHLSMELNNDKEHGELFAYEDIDNFIGEIE